MVYFCDQGQEQKHRLAATSREVSEELDGFLESLLHSSTQNQQDSNAKSLIFTAFSMMNFLILFVDIV